MESAAPRRLCDATLASLPSMVQCPNYEPSETRIGIVHLGAGAFHRAHQAAYIDALLHDEPHWAICAVSLHGSSVRDALLPQDGLYTLATVAETTQLRVIGSIRELLCARDEPEAVLARLSDPAVRLVTLTVTEKGYCLAGDDLDVAHPDIVHDLASPDAPDSAVGYLVAALRRRRDRGVAPFTVLSCDNLADNGGKLQRAVRQFAARIDGGLEAWIVDHVTFPRSMVDSITPATDDVLRDEVARRLDCLDAWPVKREPYAQWVVEDRFCNGRPSLERVGVQFSDDIAGHDRTKLRLLNAAHSSLAYLGCLLRIETVADAMRRPPLAAFVEALMRDDILPTLALPHGVDGDAYLQAILSRFRNPAIAHRLAQIAWDGSQKLPVRLLGTIADALAAARPITRLAFPVAAWMHFIRQRATRGEPLVDPLHERLAEIGRASRGDAVRDVGAFLALGSVFGDLAIDARFMTALHDSYALLGDGSDAAIALALTHIAGQA